MGNMLGVYYLNAGISCNELEGKHEFTFSVTKEQMSPMHDHSVMCK